MQLEEKFLSIFGGNSDEIRIFTSPGRVNLIGEHVDYCGGTVLPAAINMKITVAARKCDGNIIRLTATDLDTVVEAKMDEFDKYRSLEWGSYQLGVAHELLKKGLDLQGCELCYDGSIPYGSGLSSSAAIEVATALCLTTFAYEKMGKSEPVDMVEMALIGQAAENNYVGVSCGIMDQFASAMGKKDHAINLNCDDLSYTYVPVKMDGYKLVIANTNKKRSLADSKYNERRSECENGFSRLKTVLPHIKCLADVTTEEFQKNKDVFADKNVQKRVEHVVYECERVKKSIDALNVGDIITFGKLLDASHESLRDLYEVTGAELDTLVSEMRGIDGVLGARMTGAGFGGCTVALVKNEKTEALIKTAGRKYKEKIGYSASFYITEIEDGGKECK